MEDHKERNAPWLSVPQFGDWDQKGPLPDYSMDFSKIREMRKQNKTRASLGNEEELINPTANLPKSTPPNHNNNNINNDIDHDQQHSPNVSVFSITEPRLKHCVTVRNDDFNSICFVSG